MLKYSKKVNKMPKEEIADTPKTLSVTDIQKAIENSTSYHKLRQELMHLLGKITKQDEAEHFRNLYRAELMRPDNQNKSKMKYTPFKFKPSAVEDEYAEFRTPAEKDGGFV